MIAIGATTTSSGRYGRGTGPIFYADVQCGGLEAQFSECSKGDLEQTNCDHSQDARINCLPGNKITCVAFA